VARMYDRVRWSVPVYCGAARLSLAARQPGGARHRLEVFDEAMERDAEAGRVRRDVQHELASGRDARMARVATDHRRTRDCARLRDGVSAALATFGRITPPVPARRASSRE